MTNDSDTQVETEIDDTETTKSTRTRWSWTGTIAALLILISLVVLVLLAAWGFFNLGAVTQPWLILYGTIALMAATWTFGKETLEAVREARGK